LFCPGVDDIIGFLRRNKSKIQLGPPPPLRQSSLRVLIFGIHIAQFCYAGSRQRGATPQTTYRVIRSCIDLLDFIDPGRVRWHNYEVPFLDRC
jgi:hypothetical protein